MSANTRLALGAFLIVFSNLLFLTHAWIYWMPWSAGVKSALFTMFFFTPEVGTLIAVAIMGKENFERFKGWAYAFIGRIKPAGNVGPIRHKVGLVMFLLPLLPAYIQAYSPQWLPDSSPLRIYVKVATDLLFIGSLFVLGGDFWDKLRALFVREARVVFPNPSEPQPNPPSSGDDSNVTDEV